MYKRIVSLAPSNTEILYALGAEDRLAACTRYCDFPEEAGEKPRIGGWIDINDGLVKSYNPDLVLTSTFVQNKITSRYKKSKMNIVSLMPTTLKGVFGSISKIGKLVGKEKEAINAVNSMKESFNKIKIKIKKSRRSPRIYIEEWHKPPTVSGNWVPTLAKMAGGDYSLIKAGVHSREVSNEQIQKYDPEVIVISICGMADKAPKEWVTKRKGWENLSAVKNGKVYVFDDSWLNRPGPRLVVGLQKLAEVIHPECFHRKN
ncbi:cobalamin-binding protein [Candidatus Woesearchaeota archaeon]|nr:cobalamin-binding protein [Candidatus Woesearchaeota archaeon]